MSRFRDIKFKKHNLHEQRLLEHMRRAPLVSRRPAEDKNALRRRLLSVIEKAIDEKLATMEPGQGLGIVFRLEVLLPCRDARWAEAVKKRDGYRCQECGSTENVEAHHREPVEDNPALIGELDNGVTLCVECHAAKHPEQATLILSKYAKAHQANA